MVVLVFAAVIATALYTLWDPSRASQAKTAQLNMTVERGAYLFSQNCRVCHGNSGEGGQASSRLPEALVLDRFDLQGRKTPNGPVDATSKSAAYNLIVNTLTCGRVGKYMPPWSIAQGGTLTNEQINQLATFITEGTGWQEARDFAVYGDPKYTVSGDITAGIKLVKPISATDTVLHLSDVTPLGKGQRIQMGEHLNAPKADDTNEIMLITANPDTKAKTVTVERHIGLTKAVAHAAGVPVLVVPAPPNPPAITGSGGPVCGQYYVPVPTPSAAAGTPAASPTAATAATAFTIIGKNLTFDKTALTGAAGKVLTITFKNEDAGVPHNIHFYNGASATAPSIGKTDIVIGPVTQTLKIGPLQPGKYYFQCDVHPTQMNGVLTVQ